MIMTHSLQLLPEFTDMVIRQCHLVLFGLFYGDKRVCGNDFGLQVWEGPDAEVLLAPVYILVHDESDKEPQFGYLAGDGLNVNAIDTVLDEIEFSCIV
jgi:hypothetical protein